MTLETTCELFQDGKALDIEVFNDEDVYVEYVFNIENETFDAVKGTCTPEALDAARAVVDRYFQ